MSYVETILEHFGTKGMKWGVRKRAATSKSSSEDAKLAGQALVKVKKAGGTHVLSNNEMSALVKRMDLENKLKAASAQQTTIAKGQRIVNKYLSVGNTANDVVKFANTPVGKQLTSALGGKTGKHAK